MIPNVNQHDKDTCQHNSRRLNMAIDILLDYLLRSYPGNLSDEQSEENHIQVATLDKKTDSNSADNYS